MDKIIIFGIGQTSEIVSSYIEESEQFEIIGYTIDSESELKEKKSFRNKDVFDFSNIEEIFNPNEYKMFVAIGYSDLNKLREAKYHKAKEKGYHLVSFIHPKSGVTRSTSIGENSFIMENQSIQPFSKIGNNCFIWGGVLIAHHSVIDDHCWITSEASIAGNTTIGKRCFIGINSTIGHMINIGDDCFIGAGSLVTRDAKDGQVFIEKNTDVFKLNSEQFLKITKMK